MPFVAFSEVGQANYLSFMAYYVYILRSTKDGSYYTGVTSDLRRRIGEHHSGSPKYSSTKGPFNIVWYGAFMSKERAYEFEVYLKSGSGFAFRNKHLV